MDMDAPVRWTLTYFTEMLIDSANSRSVNAGAARWGYAKTRGAWCTVMRLFKRQHEIPDPVARRRVTITRFFSGRKRLMDQINFASGCKPLLDAMVIEGLIVDDSVKWVEDIYKQVRHSDLSDGTAIVIQELLP